MNFNIVIWIGPQIKNEGSLKLEQAALQLLAQNIERQQS